MSGKNNAFSVLEFNAVKIANKKKKKLNKKNKNNTEEKI